MKKNIIKTAIAGLALAAVFTGCYNPVNLADTKNEVAKYNATVATGSMGTAEAATATGDVTAVTTTLKAGTDYKTKNLLTIEVTANASVKLDVFKEAVAIYGLKDNTKNKFYPSVLDAAITYEVVDYYESYVSGKVKQSAILDVNLKSYKKNKIAVKVDATKLKDVKGTFILNEDGNENLGEATDSKIISVDTNGTEALNGSVIMPLIKKYTITATPNNKISATDPKVIEGIEYTIAPIVKSQTEAGVITYVDNIASLYTSVLKMQTIAPGANAWTDVALNFTWDATNKVYKALFPIASATAGTKYRLVKTNDPAFSVATEVYDAPYVLTYSKKKTYSADATSTSNYYPKATDVIISSETIADMNYVQGDVTTAQKGLLVAAAATSTTKDGFGARWEVTIGKEMVSYTDLIVVNNKTMKKVPADIKVLNTDSEKGWVNKIAVEVTDLTYKTSDVDLYVGPGCSIKENPANKSQLKFGTGYADWSAGDASGYVKLN